MRRQLLLQKRHIRQLSHELFFKGLGTAMLILLGLTGRISAQTTFTYIGGTQPYIVPAGVTSLIVDAQGATGGASQNSAAPGGAGGHITAIIPVTAGEILTIRVGGAGGAGISGAAGSGGYNGGGNGAPFSTTNTGGGGGGATTLQRGTTSLVVAGGGGGAGDDCPSGDDGGASATTGLHCTFLGNGAGEGATTSTAGAGGSYLSYNSGASGTLGAGGDAGSGTAGGGGGGGYYGGGGGSWGGGGGGSNYVISSASAVSIVTAYNTAGNGSITLTPVVPYFVSSNDMLAVCENSGATSINSLLDVTYTSTNMLTWSTSMAPAHGALVASYTAPGNGATVTPAGLTYSPDASYSGLDTFVVSVTDGGYTAYDTIYVTVNPTPATIGGSTFLCTGNTYILTNDSTGGTWSSSNIAIAGINASTGSVTAISTGTATITYTLPGACYSTKVVTVNPQPSAIGGNSALCFGSTTTLTNDSTGGEWTSSNTLVATVGSASGVVTTTGVGNSVVTYTLPAGCFSITTVTVNPQPSAIGGNTSLCLGNTYTLTNDSTGGVWSSSDATVAAIDPATGELTTPGAGSATITYNLPGGCYSTLAVTVHPIPALTSLAIAPNTCGNTTFTYFPTSDVPVDSFTWVRTATYGISNASASGTGSISETLIDTVDVKTPVSYVYTLHLANCTSTYVVIDTVLPRPRLTTTTSPAAICDSTLFTYVPSSTQGGTTYSWVRPFVAGISSLTNSGTGNISEVLHNTANTNKNVVYTYTLTANGCSNTQDVTVQVHPKPVLTTLTSASICSGSSFDYTPANTLIIPVATAWTRPAVSGILPATLGTGTNAIHETLTNTTGSTLAVSYLYTLTVVGTSCFNAQTVTVNVMPAAVAPSIATRSPANLCVNTMYQNFGAATAPASGVAYHWSASNATIYAHGTTGQYALVNFPNSGTAIVRLAALYGTLGCPAQDSFVVTVGTDTAATLTVIKDNTGALVALENNVDTYQWGYDDTLTLDSTLLAGENNQIYFPSAGLVAGRNYWVITKSGECLQKAYYHAPTGVTNINDITDVMNVYPNPAQHQVTVAVSAVVTGDITVEVTNLLGQKVASASAVNNQAHIAVSELPAGCYIVDCFANGTRIGTAKFIKN